jgi:hypothetical protein
MRQPCEAFQSRRQWFHGDGDDVAIRGHTPFGGGVGRRSQTVGDGIQGHGGLTAGILIGDGGQACFATNEVDDAVQFLS